MLNWILTVGILATGVLFLLICYIKCLERKGFSQKLYYKESQLNEYLLKNCLSMQDKFKPTIWAANGLLQSMLGLALFKIGVSFEREYLQMRDMGIIALDWCKQKDFLLKRSSPIIIILPGVVGDKNGVSSLCYLAAKKGYRTVVMNARGHGNSYLSTCKLQNFGDPSDFRQCVLYINRMYPKATVSAVAVGSGSLVLFSYLGEFGSSCRLRAASFISPFYDINEHFFQDLPKIYQYSVLIGLKNVLLRHSKPLEKIIDVQSALSKWDLLQYIEKVYSEPQGYKSVGKFLENNDPLRDVDDIAIPVMCINSADDPVSRPDNISFDLFNFYPNMLLVFTQRGGHCGFWKNLFPSSWANELALDYISTVLDFTLNNNRQISSNSLK